MAESACVALLQWALPHLGLTWSGFRRVHRQVCRRVGRRMAELHLPGPEAYRRYLEEHPEEWEVLDSCCRISVSRMLRDRPVFDRLAGDVLPELAREAMARGTAELRAWSAGCASGEEPYGLALLWRLALSQRFPGLGLHIVATDADAALLERARLARFTRSSLREVPAAWVEAAFTRAGRWLELRREFRAGVEFLAQDLRTELPDGVFDLVLCRNLALTYFDERLRRWALERLLSVLRAGGALVIGLKERLPEGIEGLAGWATALGIYRRVPAPLQEKLTWSSAFPLGAPASMEGEVPCETTPGGTADP